MSRPIVHHSRDSLKGNHRYISPSLMTISTCSSHRQYKVRGFEEQEPCLLDQSMVIPPHSFNERAFSMVMDPRILTERNHNLQSLKRMDSMNGSLNESPLALVLNGAQTTSPSTALSANKNQCSPSSSSSQCASRCLLCLLINVVFIFAVFIAFLVGHWASSSLMEQFFNNNATANYSSPVNRSLTPSKHAIMTDLLTLNATFTQKQHILQETDYDKGGYDRNGYSTIFDIYPPSFDEDNSFENTLNLRLHRFTNFDYYRNGSSGSSPDMIHDKTNADVPLPKSILPTHYDLQLDFSTFDTDEYVSGNASILLHSYGNATNAELVFHAAANIFLSRIRIHKSYSAEFVVIKSVKRNFQHDLVRIILAERLELNRKYKLDVEFRTKICQSNAEGAYCFRSTLLDQDNKTFVPHISGFVTRFEPRFARTFLPCWDEPRVKTTFNVSVVHSDKFSMVLSNMPFISQRSLQADNENVINEDSEVTRKILRTQFATTPLMSVYLLAFAVGTFIPLELRGSSSNTPITIWVEPENVVAVHFAANFSPVMFDRIQEDFVVKYPIGKLDLIVVPNFPVGGMENWGLIIFHARYLLSTTNSATIDNNQNGYGRLNNNMAVDRASEEYKIEKIITHEIVHQWFGNLVTMYDWDELWLKEGFTTYFVYDLLNEAHPHLTEYEYYQNLVHLFNKQSSVSSQALVRTSATKNADLFDGVALYTKGAVVVKMIKDLVGTLEFHAAITRFLKKHAFKSVNEHSLWSCLPASVDHGAEQELLVDIMHSWLYNDGIPEVLISRNYEDQSIRITQQPANLNRYAIFLSDGFANNENNAVDTVRSRKNRSPRDIVQNDSIINQQKRSLADIDSFADNKDDENGSATDGNDEILGSNCSTGKRAKRDCFTVRFDTKLGRNIVTYNDESSSAIDFNQSVTILPPKNISDNVKERDHQCHHHHANHSVSSTSSSNYSKKEKAHAEMIRPNNMSELTHRLVESIRIRLGSASDAGQQPPITSTTVEYRSSSSKLITDDKRLSTFDDSFFTTPTNLLNQKNVESSANPTKKLRGSKRKRLKFGRRKNLHTKRRHGSRDGSAKQVQLHGSQHPIKSVSNSASKNVGEKMLLSRLPNSLPHSDLSRLPVFSEELRGRNGGRLPANWLQDQQHRTAQTWQGGAARRLSSIQTFGANLPTVAEMMDNVYDEDDLKGSGRQARAKITASKEAPKSTKSEAAKNLWWIPLSYAFGSARSTAGQTIRQFWLRNQTLRFVDVGLFSGQYLLANPHWIYPYRINYDIRNWQMIIQQLHVNHQEIPVMSRMQLLVDGEAYLSQSAVPHLYLQMISYLAKETELGVLLVGLDAIHALVDAFSGTRILGALMVQLLPVVQQLDRQLAATSAGEAPPEKAALWLLNPLRLAKLYQLRCLANLGTCAENHQVSKWLAHPTALDAEHHQQITAICHYLFQQAGTSELTLLAGLLRQRSTQWSVLIQLASCVRDDGLIRAAVEQIIRTRNAAVFLFALKGGYSVQYNRRFRELFWSGVERLSLHERRLLFAVNTGRSDRVARQFLHAARTPDELARIEALLPQDQWPTQLRLHLIYLRRKLAWLHGRAIAQFHAHMLNPSSGAHIP